MSAILGSPILGFFGFGPKSRPKRAGAERREPKIARAAPVDEIPVPMPAPKLKSQEPALDAERILAATQATAVELAPIEWDGDRSLTKRADSVGEVTGTYEALSERGSEAMTRRIRDRYIGARFPGIARSAADLEATGRVVKAARLFFEDNDIDSALELLDLAVEQNSREQSLWLAQLEILFLARDAARFVECARAFHAMHPASEAWPEVGRLGRALAPGEPLFGESCGPRDHEHYGPWPDLPNWIQANWDLTAEVVAADFHRLMKRRAAESRLARANPPLAA